MSIGILEDVLDDDMFERVMSLFEMEMFDDRYTEHEGRKGLLIKDEEVIDYLNLTVKTKILEQLEQEEKRMEISDVYGCIDEKYFSIPYHIDDVYKYVSCVLYCGEGFKGTAFLGDGMKKSEIVPKRNRLLYFLSRDKIHCVPRGEERRYTLQFHYIHK